jgi:succinyl-CoA synthetase beta subunit
MIAEALQIVRRTTLTIQLDPRRGIALNDLWIDPNVGLTREQALTMAQRLGFSERLNQAGEQMMKLYRFFVKYDCTEIGIS